MTITTMIAPAPPHHRVNQRSWSYAEHVFLECNVPGEVAAALLAGEIREVAGWTISVPRTHETAHGERVASRQDRRGLSTPWPRTDWEVTAAQHAGQTDSGVLVGSGPSFLSRREASFAFFYESPVISTWGQPPLWRVHRADRRGWIHRVIIAPDMLDVSVKGSEPVGLVLELTSPTSYQRRPVGRTGRVRLRVPGGLPDHSTLMLRRADDWQDYRHFAPVSFGHRSSRPCATSP